MVVLSSVMDAVNGAGNTLAGLSMDRGHSFRRIGNVY